YPRPLQTPRNDPGLMQVDIVIVDCPSRQREILITLRECRHAPGNVDACADSIRGEIAGVSEAKPLIIEHSDANATLSPSDDGLDRTLLDLDRSRLGLASKDFASPA